MDTSTKLSTGVRMEDDGAIEVHYSVMQGESRITRSAGIGPDETITVQDGETDRGVDLARMDCRGILAKLLQGIAANDTKTTGKFRLRGKQLELIGPYVNVEPGMSDDELLGVTQEAARELRKVFDRIERLRKKS